MTIEIEAENAQQAEAMVRETYNNEEYLLDAEHYAGVEFAARERNRNTEQEPKAPQV